jgi:protocatechuate 3,4-dioxygenase beta subunit
MASSRAKRASVRVPSRRRCRQVVSSAMTRAAAVAVALGALALGLSSAPQAASVCRPTQADALGPFYEPGAPVRSKVGTGYVLSGRVLAARTCRVIPRARIEFWLANAQGEYDDAHRATVIAGRRGGYRFESNKPPAYESRPPHIHIRVSARGYRTLVTQHYPRATQTRAVFNLVLVRR